MSTGKDPFEKEIETYKKYKNHVEKEARRKNLKSARKNSKRQSQSKRVRKKAWLPDRFEDWDELDYRETEPIRSNRRVKEHQPVEPAQERLKPDETEPEAQPTVDGLRGQVVEVSRGLAQVALKGQTLTCQIRGALKARETGFTNPVAVGDQVIVSEDGAAGGVIEKVLPRQTVLARPEVLHGHSKQIIVANADQLLIVSSWQEPALWPELLDRYLIAAERNRLPVLICVNKIDLAKSELAIQTALEPYRSLSYRLILTSALTGAGIEQLRATLHHKTTALTGLSGVGKSTLLNAVRPELQLPTGRISQYHAEGKHTTSQARLIRLDTYSAVIDTPGIREFGLSGLSRAELADFFPEITATAPSCRFGNCTHLNEPDCAVQTAVEKGGIAASRFHSYRQIYNSLPG